MGDYAVYVCMAIVILIAIAVIYRTRDEKQETIEEQDSAQNNSLYIVGSRAGMHWVWAWSIAGFAIGLIRSFITSKWPEPLVVFTFTQPLYIALWIRLTYRRYRYASQPNEWHIYTNVMLVYVSPIYTSLLHGERLSFQHLRWTGVYQFDWSIVLWCVVAITLASLTNRSMAKYMESKADEWNTEEYRIRYINENSHKQDR